MIEHDWLEIHYPDYTLIEQSLIADGGKHYDVMPIKTANGEEKKIYFDISDFFGKF